MAPPARRLACVRAVSLVALLLASSQGAPVPGARALARTSTDYGLRGLATTWETDDDNSILQLVGLPRSASAKVEIIGPTQWYDSPENSGLPLLPCAMSFDAGGTNTSATIATRAPAFFFATGNALGPTRIYTIDAVSGTLIRNVSVRFAQPLAVTAIAFNPAKLLLDALVYVGPAASAVPAAASIDPVTGAVELLVAQLVLPDFQGPCEASIAAHVQAGSRLFFVQQNAKGWQRANETYLMGLELATGNVTQLVAWSPRAGMLSNVAAVDAAAPGGAELVVYTISAWDQDLNTTAELTLWALDPSVGAASAAVVAVVANPQAGDGPLLPTWGTLAVSGAGAARIVTMLVTNNNGRIFTYIVALNVTVSAHSIAAAGVPQVMKLDDSDVTGGMVYIARQVVA